MALKMISFSHPSLLPLVSTVILLLISIQASMSQRPPSWGQPPQFYQNPAPTPPRRQFYHQRGFEYQNVQPQRFVKTVSRQALVDMAAFQSRSYHIPHTPGVEYHRGSWGILPTGNFFFDRCDYTRQPVVPGPANVHQHYGRKIYGGPANVQQHYGQKTYGGPANVQQKYGQKTYGLNTHTWAPPRPQNPIYNPLKPQPQSYASSNLYHAKYAGFS
ncbi:uncharacterized protein LOC124155073 [Ischnura elegans]|uniref:uncharacterized protein LOC124155073 n=1 Tax=Ischnura elegans TaxID=197161 RepID=UPI001ED8BBDB|nr:uncharacterized protein LOC124155073 [Ischnura elegans]